MSPDIVLEWDWLNDQLRHTLHTLYYTPMGTFMRSVPWMRAAFDFLQVLGMSLLLGAICVLDLRLMGYPRTVPPAALRGMIRVADTGMLLTLISGVLLLCGSPDIYLFNAAVRWKVVFVLIAALNLLLFGAPVFRGPDAMNTRASSPVRRVLAGGGLAACVAALWAARLAGGSNP